MFQAYPRKTSKVLNPDPLSSLTPTKVALLPFDFYIGITCGILFANLKRLHCFKNE
jgi:hypothetical protein